MKAELQTRSTKKMDMLSNGHLSMTSSLSSWYVKFKRTTNKSDTYLQVAYQRILQLTYVDDLLAAMKRLFVQYFDSFVTAFVASLHSASSAKAAASQAISWDFAKAFERWDVLFDKLLKGLEEKAALVCLIGPSFHN